MLRRLKCVLQQPWCILVSGGLLVTSSAWAHHMEGGNVPQTFLSGLLSGLAHPVIGMDHLSAVLIIGLLSVVVTKRFTDLVLFLGLSLLGCVLRVKLGALPGVELAVSLSLVALLFGLWSKQRWVSWSRIVIAIAAVFHGYAYGESVVGGETQALFAYLLGLAIIQGTLAYSFGWLAARLAQANPRSYDTLENVLSAVASGTALVFLFGALA